MASGVRRRVPGLRIKTENKGFAGNRAQTAPVLQREKRVLHFFLGDFNKRTNLHRSATA